MLGRGDSRTIKGLQDNRKDNPWYECDREFNYDLIDPASFVGEADEFYDLHKFRNFFMRNKVFGACKNKDIEMGTFFLQFSCGRESKYMKTFVVK